MKIRYKHVSNSSSSNFILIGKLVSYGQIDLDKGEFWAIGGNFGEGADAWELTKDDLMLLPFIDEFFSYMQVVKVIKEACFTEIDFSPFAGRYSVWQGQVDDWAGNGRLDERYELDLDTLKDAIIEGKIDRELFLSLLRE